MPLLTLPVRLLDVIVHLVGQALAALLAAVLDHFTAALALHAGAEAVLPRSASLLRLVRSLWHKKSTSSFDAYLPFKTQLTIITDGSGTVNGSGYLRQDSVTRSLRDCSDSRRSLGRKAVDAKQPGAAVTLAQSP